MAVEAGEDVEKVWCLLCSFRLSNGEPGRARCNRACMSRALITQTRSEPCAEWSRSSATAQANHAQHETGRAEPRAIHLTCSDKAAMALGRCIVCGWLIAPSAACLACERAPRCVIASSIRQCPQSLLHNPFLPQHALQNSLSHSISPVPLIISLFFAELLPVPQQLESCRPKNEPSRRCRSLTKR
jgi:hypothetical protein